MRITETGYFRNITDPVSQQGMMVQYAEFVLIKKDSSVLEWIYDVRLFGRRINQIRLKELQSQIVTATMQLKSREVEKPNYTYRTMYLILEGVTT